VILDFDDRAGSVKSARQNLSDGPMARAYPRTSSCQSKQLERSARTASLPPAQGVAYARSAPGYSKMSPEIRKPCAHPATSSHGRSQELLRASCLGR